MTSKREERRRCLLATMTKEPFQPVRLYFTVPDESFVVKALKEFECMEEAPYERCWQWLFHAEAARLRFAGGGYDDVPKEQRPIVLGRIRFPKQSGMTLETNSIERAVEGESERLQSPGNLAVLEAGKTAHSADPDRDGEVQRSASMGL